MSCCPSGKATSCCKRSHSPGWIAGNTSCQGTCACAFPSSGTPIIAAQRVRGHRSGRHIRRPRRTQAPTTVLLSSFPLPKTSSSDRLAFAEPSNRGGICACLCSDSHLRAGFDSAGVRQFCKCKRAGDRSGGRRRPGDARAGAADRNQPDDRTTTDREGRFRFPYLRVGAYEIMVHQPGFAAAVRRLSLSVGAAYDVAGIAHHRRPAGRKSRLSARRRGRRLAGTVSADRGPVPAAERAQFPRPRASGSGRLADQYRQQSTLRRDLRRAGTRHLGRQPAQLLQQLHRRRPLRQRRRRRPERHLLRPRRGRRVSGGDVGRTGGVGARARRLRQRGHQERHQCAARRASTATSATSGSMPPIRFPTRNCR